jgi:hypothetical protein
MDIYEGLRNLYPAMHASVMDEENWERARPATLSEEDVEEAWARYDYLEWLHD